MYMSSAAEQNTSSTRVDWVDIAKGICIFLVVMMHTALGVSEVVTTNNFVLTIVNFAQPFRIPDFFLISGLFLAATINRDWVRYFDRKVLHFAYFYLLWLIIQSVVRIPFSLADNLTVADIALQFATNLVQPFGVLWFVYLLPILFMVVRMTHILRIPHWVMLAIGAALEIAPIHTGSVLIDEFAARFVYFYAGYALAPIIFKLAEQAGRKVLLSLVALAGWALFNGLMVNNGTSQMPVMSLALGTMGAMAVVTMAALLAKIRWAEPIRYIGENSIVIYLGFSIPMAFSRIILIKLGIIEDAGILSTVIIAIAVVSPIILFWIVRNTPLNFLFRRPEWLRLESYVGSQEPVKQNFVAKPETP